MFSFCQYISLILRVHFPYSAGIFSLFCWYIYLILQVHLPYSPGKPYSASTFLLFCQYISLILPVHFPYFVGLCHNCNFQLLFIYVPRYHLQIFSFSLGTFFTLPFIHSESIFLQIFQKIISESHVRWVLYFIDHGYEKTVAFLN
jgi:hypothetical protein